MKPFSPSLALPGARMARLMGLWALVSRLYVYLSGFVAIFLMAANVSPARFGEYSIYQSVLEVALVVGTLGSTLLFSRNATAVPPAVTQGDVVRTLAFGLPLATALVVVILTLQRLPVADVPFVLVVVTLAVFSFNCLRLAYSRGLGHAGLLNLEAGIRSTILVLGVGICASLGFELGVAHLLLINLFAFVVVCAAICIPPNGAAPPAGRHVLALASQASATVYSLLTFLLRKSDLLIVAFFMPLSYVGAFKLAFLLAEAPSQFVQAFLFTKTPAMMDADPEKLAASKLQLARHSFLLGCALFVGLAGLITVAAPLLKMGDQARTIFLCIAPYFLLRTYTIHHEMVLSLKTSMGSLGRWALLEVTLRLLSYGVVILLFPGRPHYVFFIACLSDFALYETRMRLQFGFFPIVRLLRRSP
ncbi:MULTISPECIES: lipopolysaccharide biosynthesis protein [Variovorax]|jgi:O-antigen/teichoic acid export membrane protein|uniref:lipopolysaccharide biosynthesis protein n=1 Tax=Variovorax TaxID=34072 RepID=UPI00086D79CC|nr:MULTISPECIES: polysaccharide biosynthesis protein [Variovorax]MBN8751873.1 polysaccharide biosynthesis protein [Variovorax sp.]ODU17693.1 MAG: polysaccharide biosynthesis protein [Variovorax sp. SCN 67-85]ODV27050.1 MAG: polysaccharide biosynthesis protein [Variovorax sp. SCN 67-20]OJZ09295.1 MAG: polysaccharide biosynthesis protein [Variovorax sp. 67-131]UKI04871.1 polysaccharide biosynthesis protein [Variovorax paradoxus]